MTTKIPVRVNYTNGNPTGLAEYQDGETIDSVYLPKNGWTYVATTTPSSAVDGETWYNPTTKYTFLYKFDAWHRITTDDQLAEATEINSINAGHF